MCQVFGCRVGTLRPQVQHNPAWTNQNQGTAPLTTAEDVCLFAVVWCCLPVVCCCFLCLGGVQPSGSNRSLREGDDQSDPDRSTWKARRDRKPGSVHEQRLRYLDVWSCEFRLILDQSLDWHCVTECVFVFRWFGSMEENTCRWPESLTSCAGWVSHWNVSLRNMNNYRVTMTFSLISCSLRTLFLFLCPQTDNESETCKQSAL